MRVALALAFSLLWSITATAQPPLTLSEVRGRIAHDGALTTLHQLYQNKKEWHELLSNISSGDSRWLRIGLQLHRVSDAGPSEMLQLAMGEALEHQPINVLGIVVPRLGVKAICGGPDIDDRRYDSYALAINAIKLRQRKLREIENHRNTDIRDQCISELEKSKIGIAKFYGVNTH